MSHKKIEYRIKQIDFDFDGEKVTYYYLQVLHEYTDYKKVFLWFKKRFLNYMWGDIYIYKARNENGEIIGEYTKSLAKFTTYAEAVNYLQDSLKKIKEADRAREIEFGSQNVPDTDSRVKIHTINYV